MLSTKKILEAVANNLDVDYREYSGRGMNGTTCPGIIGAGAFEIAAEVVAVFQEEFNYPEDGLAGFVLPDFATETQLVLEELSDFRQDSMGRDTIIYWPRIQD